MLPIRSFHAGDARGLSRDVVRPSKRKPRRRKARSGPTAESIAETIKVFERPRARGGPAQPAQRTETIIRHGDVGPDAMGASKSRERIARLQGITGLILNGGQHG
jgi:hypothetical protein